MGRKEKVKERRTHCPSCKREVRFNDAELKASHELPVCAFWRDCIEQSKPSHSTVEISVDDGPLRPSKLPPGGSRRTSRTSRQ
jgi:hypothetical protein